MKKKESLRHNISLIITQNLLKYIFTDKTTKKKLHGSCLIMQYSLTIEHSLLSTSDWLFDCSFLGFDCNEINWELKNIINRINDKLIKLMVS